MHSIHALINEARAAFPPARLEYRRLRQARARLHEDGEAEEGAGRRGGGGGARGGGGEGGGGGGDDVELDLDEKIGAAAGRVLSATRALLLVNADHGSAWNARKELVVDGLCEGSSISHEMKASRGII